jgi:radical SAM protein with 4Fe4S-binding SPASM domain
MKIVYPNNRKWAQSVLARFGNIKCLTAAKAVNFFSWILQNLLMPDKSFALPVQAVIETSRVCGMGCRFCPVGRGLNDRAVQFMESNVFYKAMEPLVPYLFEVHLFNWGEPLLDPNIYNHIKFLSQRKVRTIISSNMMPYRPEAAKEMFDSGLDTLIAAIDGTSEETYRQYRAGGNFTQAIDAIRDIVKQKKISGRRSPRIIWQYVVFKHNQHQLKDAKDLAISLGVDELRYIPTSPSMDTEVLRAPKEKLKELRPVLPDDKEFHLYREGNSGGGAWGSRRCTYPWNGIVVRADGGVAVCCNSYAKTYDVGNVKEKSILEIWNGPAMQNVRRAIRTKGKAGGGICQVCLSSGTVLA